jgi:hypothetical protein
MRRYRVHVNTNRRKYVYFPTLKTAKGFCSEVFRQLGIVLSIEKIPGKKR